MTPTGSEPLPPRGAAGPTSHQDVIATSRSASARISTVRATWSSGSSTKSSTVGAWQRATTSWRPTTLHSSSLRQYGYGCALMSSRPSKAAAAMPRVHEARATTVSQFEQHLRVAIANLLLVHRRDIERPDDTHRPADVACAAFGTERRIGSKQHVIDTIERKAANRADAAAAQRRVGVEILEAIQQRLA